MSEQAPERLLLVDGSSYLYRAFHALPPLSNSRGDPTGAVYGVTNMLLKLLREYESRYVAVLFDAGGKTFRDEIYEQYKAQRPPMPDELRAQVKPLREIVEALGLPIIEIPGVEADDVIGTLASRAGETGMITLISTIDKDMAQLVDERVTIVDTMFNRVFDTAKVRERFGVEPKQMIDYLALVGDTSDNIPGVPGVGPKTAAGLLAHFRGIDDIFADLDEVANVKVRGAKKLGEKLREHHEAVLLSRQLATIVCDVELPFGPTELNRRDVDEDRLREVYSRLELTSLVRQLGEVEETPAAERVAGDYSAVLDESALETLVAALSAARHMALECVTTDAGYMDATLVGLGVAVEAGTAWYLPLAHTYAGAPDQLSVEQALAALRPLLEDESRPKLGHDLKRTAHVLGNHGIVLRGMSFDPMLESYVLNSTATRHDLDAIAGRYLQYDTVRYEDVAGKGAKQLGFAEVSLEQATPYAAENADITLQLHNKLWPRLRAVPALARLYREVEQPLVAVLRDMEHTGVLIDSEMLTAQSAELHQRMAEIEQRAHDAAGSAFNLESPKQLQEILFERLELPVLRRTPKKQPSTAEDVLAELARDYPLPQLILDYRSLSKLRTYTEKLPLEINARTGRIHTTYHQAVSVTGRLSSSDPNLQNIPTRTADGRRIRQAFIAPPGFRILAADYSQIELRIMAHLSGDAGLLQAFAEDRDIHQATAAEVFGLPPDAVPPDQRRAAKAINFGLIYGMSAFGLGKQLNIERRAAQTYIDRYFERYPGVARYMEETRETAREQGYVETVFGRRLYLNDIRSRNAQRRQYAERSAINAPMQGTAADIIKRAMIALQAQLAKRAAQVRMVMQVHDELVLEVAEDQAAALCEEVRDVMAGAADLAVPLKVDTGLGTNWDEAH